MEAALYLLSTASSSVQGFDKEYDRVLEENKLLQRRLAQLDATSSYRDDHKKDD